METEPSPDIVWTVEHGRLQADHCVGCGLKADHGRGLCFYCRMRLFWLERSLMQLGLGALLGYGAD